MTVPQTNKLTVMENETATFECVTSAGLPAPDVRWYMTCGSSETEYRQFLAGSTETIVVSENLLKKTSRLVYKPSNADYGCRVFCVANNTEIDFSSSIKPLLNVQCK